MRGTGKSSTGKSTLAMPKPLLAMAFLSASAALALLPTAASAQFNIDGMIRGAIGQRGYGYRQPSHHSSHHDSADKSKDDKNRDSDQDAADSKTGKGIKSGNDNNNARDSGDSQSAASNTPPPKTGPSGGGSSPPKSSDSDVPAFAPSR